MSKLIKAFAGNKEKENNGVWFDYPEYPNDDGSIPGFLVGRYSRLNKRFRKAAAMFAEENKDLIKSGINDEEDEKAVELFVDGGLISWRNIQGDNGETIEFNRANALKLFKEDAPHLYTELVGKANEAANYRGKTLDETAKN